MSILTKPSCSAGLRRHDRQTPFHWRLHGITRAGRVFSLGEAFGSYEAANAVAFARFQAVTDRHALGYFLEQRP